jgi:hypothetical protein
MKECVQVILSDTNIDDKLVAFEDLEMLVESLDNANGITGMLLIYQTYDHLDYGRILLPNLIQTSQSCECTLLGPWELQFRIMNVPRTTYVLYLPHIKFLESDGLSPIIHAIKDTDVETAGKALRCVSGLIQHNKTAFKEFYNCGGFRILAEILSQSSELKIINRTVFLMTSLLQSDTVKIPSFIAADKEGMPKIIVDAMVRLLDALDLDTMEKALTLLSLIYERKHEYIAAVNLEHIRTKLMPHAMKLGADQDLLNVFSNT